MISEDVTLGPGESKEWLFDLDTDNLLYGDVGFEDTIVTAELDIDIWGFGKSTFTIYDDGDGFSKFEKELVFIFNDVEFNVLAGLQDNHLMNITIGNYKNFTDKFPNMLVTNVSLSGKYCDAPAPAPEPTTMLLFGTGLIGLAGISRHSCQ